MISKSQPTSTSSCNYEDDEDEDTSLPLPPFFFFSIGGYLVIDGQLSLGALVAVLAAFKDFSAPLRELFRYYQSLEDVRIRFDEINKFLAEGSSQDQQPSI